MRTVILYLLLLLLVVSGHQANLLAEEVDEKIEYLIVTGDHLVDTLKPLAEWKTAKGVPAQIVSVGWIEENYEGRDEAEKIRAFIKDMYDHRGVKYVLLAGDVDTIPMRYVYLEEVYGEYSPPYTIPTDDYYCNLESTWDLDGDGVYGEPASLFDLGEDEIDWTPEPNLYLGRLPADDSDDMTLMVDKILAYQKNPADGAWRRRIILAAAVFDEETDCSDILEYQADIYFREYETINLFESAPLESNQREDTLTSENFLRAFNEGAVIVYCRGHGDITCLAQLDSTLYEWGNYSSVEEIYHLKNDGMLPFVMQCACLTGYIDYPDGDCVGEALMKAPDGGAIIFIGSVRESFTEADFIFDDLFGSADLRPGVAFRKAKIDGLEWTIENGSLDDWEHRVFPIRGIMLGDPELQLVPPVTEKETSAATESAAGTSEATSYVEDVTIPDGENGDMVWGSAILALPIITVVAFYIYRRKKHSATPSEKASEQTLPSEEKFCIHCGNSISIDASFCRDCGEIQDE